MKVIDKEYLVKQQNKFEKAESEMMREANEIGREINRSLLLVSTVILPTSFFVFNSPDILENIDGTTEVLLSLSWLLIISSILFGILQLFDDLKFFVSWTRAKGHVIEDIVYNRISSEDDLVKSLEKHQSLPQESIKVFLYFEIICILTGSIILTTILVTFFK